MILSWKQYVWTIILPLALSGIISIFAGDIRAFLSKGKNGFDQFRLARSESRLALLNALHGHAYELLLWLMQELLFVLLLTWLAGCGLAMLTVDRPKLNPAFARIWVTSVGGIWLGTLSRVLLIVTNLRDYDRVKSALEQKILQRKTQR
jgi:hypothetical protein